MGTINFLPDNEEGKKRSRKRGSAGVEYTSGGEDPTPQPKAPKPPKVKATKPPKVKKEKTRKQKAPKAPKKKSAFSAWRATRKTKGPKPPKTKKLPKFHNAPKHEKETVAPDILHDETLNVPEVQKETPQYTPPPAPPQPVPPPAPEVSKPKQTSRVKAAPAIPTHLGSKGTHQVEDEGVANIGVNLLPRFKNGIAKKVKTPHPERNLIIIAVVSITVVLLAYGGMKLQEQRLITSTTEVEEQVAAVTQQIANYAQVKQEAAVVNENLESIDEVLQAHIYWTPFLETLETLTLSNVYYKKMDGSAASGTFVFDAVAPTYADIDSQVAILENAEQVNDVEVTSAVEEAGGSTAISFIMTVQFDPALFRIEENTYEE